MADISGDQVLLFGGRNNDEPATYYDDVWIWNMTATPVIEASPARVPDDFFLHQNYPNPFNPSTKIASLSSGMCM